MSEDRPKSETPQSGSSESWSAEGESRVSLPREADERGPDSFGDDQLQSLMKRALSTDDEGSEVDVLSAVQDKLRERSGGKFYRDGWSTSRHPPFATYFITSLMMLAVLAIIYAILTPLVGTPIAVEPEPKPVNIIPPN